MNPTPTLRESFTIHLASQKDKELAEIMFVKRAGLSKVFANYFNIQVTNATPDSIECVGTAEDQSKAKRAYAMLAGTLAANQYVNKEMIATIALEINGPPKAAPGLTDTFNTSQKSTAFVARSEKQQLQADLIDNNDIIFSIGPAGTGKTYVAMIKAAHALKDKKVKKVLLARPAQESGEKLGFLPGDANAKLGPFMRPLYDELDKIFGPKKYEEMIKNGTIEIVTFAHMRGRTFEDAFIVVDEAQNCSMEHLKMVITRLGPNSKMVITGDPQQVDLTPKELSGLQPMIDKVKGVEGVAMMFYGPEDVVRHPTVKRIIDRLEGDSPETAATQEKLWSPRVVY